MNLSKKSAKENSLNVFSLYHILKGTECNKSQKSSIKNDFFFFRCWLYFVSKLRWLQTGHNEPEYF